MVRWTGKWIAISDEAQGVELSLSRSVDLHRWLCPSVFVCCLEDEQQRIQIEGYEDSGKLEKLYINHLLVKWVIIWNSLERINERIVRVQGNRLGQCRSHLESEEKRANAYVHATGLRN